MGASWRERRFSRPPLYLELDAQGQAQLRGCRRGRDVLALWRDADGPGLGLFLADQCWHGGLAGVGGEGGSEQLARGVVPELACLH